MPFQRVAGPFAWLPPAAPPCLYKLLFADWLLYQSLMKGETFMRYMLKSGLTKTAVYQVVRDYIPSDIILPSLRKCHFRKSRNLYWLSFYSGSYGWEISFSQFDGRVRLRIERSEYLWEEGRNLYTRYPLVYVSFPYLLEHGMLRQVA